VFRSGPVDRSMSVTLIRATRYDPAAAAQVQVIAMWRVQPGALMLLGRSTDPIAKSGSARLATLTGAAGIFRAEFWPLQGEQGFTFLAAIRLPDTADRSDETELVLRGARGADRDFRLVPVATSGGSRFGEQVALLAGAHAPRIARFMLDMMASDGGSDMRQPSAVFEAFLTHAARPDGCVELIMHVPQKCVLLQGWGMRPSEAVELLLPGSALLRHAAYSGDFSRTDVTAPAVGNVLVLPPELAGTMGSVQKIFLLSENDLLCRHVVEPNMLDVNASVGQIRHLLPRLNCAAPVQALLRAAVQPLYDGRDTLNAAGRPVRAALDIAVSTTGEGAYLSGWLFDPACHMAELHLCADGFSVRLDESWERVRREDVSAAFRADPAFPFPLTEEAGFAVGVSAAPAPGQAAYLRFTFTDGELAFMPIRFVDASTSNTLKALLASVDLHKSSGLAIVTCHLAPFIARIPAPEAKPAQIVLHGPFERPLAIVVPLRAATLPRSLISGFLLDPATDDEQIVFVCGPDWNHAQREVLVGLIHFYHLPASIVGVTHNPLAAEAVRVAATLSQANDFLLTSPDIVGSTPGWRGSLKRAASNNQVLCPTILFEDRSIRFGGSKSVTFTDQAPFVRVIAPLMGACADLATTEDTTDIDSGTFACCLIPRAAVPLLAQAARFNTEFGQETAFFLSLRNAGLSGAWVPSVRVAAAEEEAAVAAPALPLVDGWMLRQSWGGSLPCVS